MFCGRIIGAINTLHQTAQYLDMHKNKDEKA